MRAYNFCRQGSIFPICFVSLTPCSRSNPIDRPIVNKFTDNFLVGLDRVQTISQTLRDSAAALIIHRAPNDKSLDIHVVHRVIHQSTDTARDNSFSLVFSRDPIAKFNGCVTVFKVGHGHRANQFTAKPYPQV